MQVGEERCEGLFLGVEVAVAVVTDGLYGDSAVARTCLEQRPDGVRVAVPQGLHLRALSRRDPPLTGRRAQDIVEVGGGGRALEVAVLLPQCGELGSLLERLRAELLRLPPSSCASGSSWSTVDW